MSDNSANSLSGNYDLTIENVQLEDEDVYQCQVTDCNIESASAYLTVLGKICLNQLLILSFKLIYLSLLCDGFR